MIENVEEIRKFISDLNVELTECPLLRMLESTQAEVFSTCDYRAIVRGIHNSDVFKSSLQAQKTFQNIVDSAGRNAKPAGSRLAVSREQISRDKVGPLLPESP